MKKIEAYKSNKDLEIEKIINEYSGYVYTIIINISKGILSDEDVEEIISDVFFILWKNRDKLDDEKKLSSYIAGIIRNLVKEKYRKLKSNLNISDYENVIKDNVDIDMICEQRERIDVVEKIVKGLKEDDILIFNFYYYSGMKISEIANALNISEFNVKMRLYRMRKKIKKELLKGEDNNDR